MTYEELKTACNGLKEFLKEREKLQEVLDVISPSSTGVVEIGGKFIDDYIKLIEINLGDRDGWVSWFVFDNDFGKNEFEVRIDTDIFKVCNEKDFYKIFKKK